MLLFIVTSLSKLLALIVPLLVAVAYMTLAERKVMASMQRRKGPNVVGFFGILQPLADGLKLLLKEPLIPGTSNKYLFLAAPVGTFMLALLSWAAIPFNSTAVIADLSVGLLYIFAISSLGVYGIIIAGWSSNSKYAFLGALRSAAQMVSYEVSLGLILVSVILLAGSLNFTDIVNSQKEGWFVFPLLPMAFMFFISCLAETNRAPFDLPEAEAELVAGYNVEYASMGFALFFLGEYANMIAMSSLCALLFLGGWQPFISASDFDDILWFAFMTPQDIEWLFEWTPQDMWRAARNVLIPVSFIWLGIVERKWLLVAQICTVFFLGDFLVGLISFGPIHLETVYFAMKTCVFLFLYIWVRASFPRYRYDQLMQLGWKTFLPLSLAFLIYISSYFQCIVQPVG